MLSNFLLSPLSILLSLATAAGILMHDTRFDKLAVTALTPLMSNTNNDTGGKATTFTTDLHIHSERHSFSQATSDLGNANPRIQPRTSDDKKHLMQKYTARGYHPFDSYNLPLA